MLSRELETSQSRIEGHTAQGREESLSTELDSSDWVIQQFHNDHKRKPWNDQITWWRTCFQPRPEPTEAQLTRSLSLRLQTRPPHYCGFLLIMVAHSPLLCATTAMQYWLHWWGNVSTVSGKSLSGCIIFWKRKSVKGLAAALTLLSTYATTSNISKSDKTICSQKY